MTQKNLLAQALSFKQKRLRKPGSHRIYTCIRPMALRPQFSLGLPFRVYLSKGSSKILPYFNDLNINIFLEN